MKLILLGAPGSGKGTQAEIISKHYQIPHLSTGEILRSEVKAGSALGQSIKATMEAGQLIADDTVANVVAQRLSRDGSQGFILDGFPRTVSQALWLDQALGSDSVDAVIELLAEEEIVLERVLSRARDASDGATAPRADDNVETMRTRLKAYWEDTAPLSAFYEQRGLLRRINGVEPIEVVTAAVLAITKAISLTRPKAGKTIGISLRS